MSNYLRLTIPKVEGLVEIPVIPLEELELVPSSRPPFARLPWHVAATIAELDGAEPLEILARCFQATLDLVFLDWNELHRAAKSVGAAWPAMMPPDCAADRISFDAEMMRMAEGLPEQGIEGVLHPEFVGPSTRAFGNVWTI